MWPIEGQSSLCDEVAQPLSICQSFCHGGGPWILAATQASPSSHGRSSAPGKFSFFPLLSFRSPSLLHQLLSQLYKLSLFSLLFPQLQHWLSEEWMWGGSRGVHAKRCGIFLSFLAPIAIRHKALCPLLHAFFSSLPSLLLLNASSFYATLWKATSSLPSEPAFIILPALPGLLTCLPMYASFFFLSVLLKQCKW